MWVLIVSFAIASGGGTNSPSNPNRGFGVAMQEFNSVQACQFASVEAQKIAHDIRVVCVPKG